MRIVVAESFAGPSIWAPLPAVVCLLDLAATVPRLADLQRPFLIAELLRFLPLMAVDGAGRSQADLERLLDSGAPGLAGLIGRAAVALQRHAGADVNRCWITPGEQDGVTLAVECWDRRSGRGALQLAVSALRRLVEAALATPPTLPAGWDPEAERQRFALKAWPGYKDINLPPFIREALRRGVPWQRVDEGSPLVRLGQGSRQRLFLRTTLHDTRQIGSFVARYKRQSHRLLAGLGLPLPRQALASTETEALAAAERIGYPVVVKPNGLGRGIAVSVGVGDAAGLRRAFALARKEDTTVVVESLIAGEDHRILVVGGQVVAVARKRPGQVVGDGKASVADLVARENRSPRREIGVQRLRFEMRFDAEAERLLEAQGMTQDSVPSAGREVALRRTANASTGGLADDLTERIHPENRRMAERAVAAIGLDVCGVDFITPDITRSWREVGGAICELNDNPGIAPHLLADGGGRDVTGPMFDLLYPPGAEMRIPVAALCGSRATAAAQLLATRLERAGRRVGLALPGGLVAAGLPLEAGAAPMAAQRMALRDAAVDAAVLQLEVGGILRAGLPFDRCDAAALAGLGVESGEPDSGSQRAAWQRDALRLLLRHTRGMVVVEADEAAALALAADVPAARLCLVDAAGDTAALQAHRARGGRTLCAAAAASGWALLQGPQETQRHLLDPATGSAGLIALALALGLGLGAEPAP